MSNGAGPSSEVLRAYGLTIPNPMVWNPTPEQMQAWDVENRKRILSDSSLKQKSFLGNLLGGIPTGIMEGLIGMEPPEKYTGEYPLPGEEFRAISNLGTQTVEAGLPFAAYGIPKLFHGTRKIFKYFDPSKYDVSDVLGWMTHAAKNPHYAARYAFGDIKGWGGGENPNIRAIVPKAENVLDLIDPTPDDLSAALATMEPLRRKEAIRVFKDARRQVAHKGDIYKYIKSSHYPSLGEIPREEIPIRSLAEKIRLTPEDFDRSLFDAIRYRDVGEEAWAFPSRTPLETPWGVPLTEPRSNLEVKQLPFDEPTGILELAPDRWENTPLNLPEVPKPIPYIDNPNLKIPGEGIPKPATITDKLNTLNNQLDQGVINYPEYVNEHNKLFPDSPLGVQEWMNEPIPNELKNVKITGSMGKTESLENWVKTSGNFDYANNYNWNDLFDDLISDTQPGDIFDKHKLDLSEIPEDKQNIIKQFYPNHPNIKYNPFQQYQQKSQYFALEKGKTYEILNNKGQILDEVTINTSDDIDKIQDWEKKGHKISEKPEIAKFETTTEKMKAEKKELDFQTKTEIENTKKEIDALIKNYAKGDMPYDSYEKKFIFLSKLVKSLGGEL
jgi:hypothetical protein